MSNVTAPNLTDGPHPNTAQADNPPVIPASSRHIAAARHKKPAFISTNDIATSTKKFFAKP
ncbi:hypothetical protein [Chromobacterium amazonense]|uniref:Uncharacterized protein n=1 Tax=Chromobacterium amazonense TaxID=1382803 RepID=A0ABU8V3Z0_9NEIS|nr:hypothetical protein [Chromobacterium amazonense]MDQ4539565.1 hypothetical protein [Chromobacterium amazonense]